MVARVKMQPMLRLEFDTAGLTANYQTMSAVGIDSDVQIFKMVNNSDVDVDVSFDGVLDHEFIPSLGAFILDLTTNAEEQKAAFQKGMQPYVKGAVAGTGNVYAIGYSQRGQ